MALFRNGNRLVDAHPLPSGDWAVENGVDRWIEMDGEFRRQWEPVGEAAVEMWRKKKEEKVEV